MVAIDSIHCFLVYPAKHSDEPPEVGQATVPLAGQLFEMLKRVFDKSDSECDIEIAFGPDDEGNQQNEARDLLVAYIRDKNLGRGKLLAERLQAVTTHRSGLGLLFFIAGQAQGKTKLVISRFPADQGVLAEQGADGLTIEFLEKVFMKSDKRYKAALYVDNTQADTAFWRGRAVDHQINVTGDVADYWIRDFLSSDLRTTPAEGTRRLAVALRTALKASDSLGVKTLLTSAATLAPSLDGQAVSVTSFCSQFNLTEPATKLVRAAMRHDNLMTEQFQFDAEEFAKHIAFRSTELDNGAILTAEVTNFDEVFAQEEADDTGRTRFTTSGRIVDERLRRIK